MYPITKTTFEVDVKNKLTIPANWYHAITFCQGGSNLYSLKTHDTRGIDSFVVTSETDVKKFIAGEGGLHYDNCKGKNMQSISKTCNVAKNSRLVIHNFHEKPIEVDYLMYNKNVHPWPDMTWNSEDLKYSEEFLKYVQKFGYNS